MNVYEELTLVDYPTSVNNLKKVYAHEEIVMKSGGVLHIQTVQHFAASCPIVSGVVRISRILCHIPGTPYILDIEGYLDRDTGEARQRITLSIKKNED